MAFKKAICSKCKNEIKVYWYKRVLYARPCLNCINSAKKSGNKVMLLQNIKKNKIINSKFSRLEIDEYGDWIIEERNYKNG